MVKIQKIRHLSATVVAIVERDGKIEEHRFPVSATDAEIEAAVMKTVAKAKKAKAKAKAKEPADA